MKKKKNPLFIIFLTLFVIFASIYFSQITGYYEVKEYKKMNITKEAMQQFESDVAEGKELDMEKYLNFKSPEYSNSFSKLGNKTSKTLEFIMTKIIKKTFGVLGKLFG